MPPAYSTWPLSTNVLLCRVGSPLVLRKLLNWFIYNEKYGSEAYPPGKGWLWASILAVLAYAYALIHHQLFW